MTLYLHIFWCSTSEIILGVIESGSGNSSTTTPLRAASNPLQLSFQSRLPAHGTSLRRTIPLHHRVDWATKSPNPDVKVYIGAPASSTTLCHLATETRANFSSGCVTGPAAYVFL
ncbi:hypothetical protein L208DRAFT_147596 [Tricholoma matsutake]|nr:hypothetical protein L208DRAFT_147596 [Tricholoma matsutake 945]